MPRRDRYWVCRACGGGRFDPQNLRLEADLAKVSECRSTFHDGDQSQGFTLTSVKERRRINRMRRTLKHVGAES